jgi:hypothetical protein
MTNAALARLQRLQNQIVALAEITTRPVTAERIAYCTADKFTAAEIKATLTMLRAVGLVA